MLGYCNGYWGKAEFRIIFAIWIKCSIISAENLEKKGFFFNICLCGLSL